jgi:Mg2+ and Co2+ transporter CorA
MDYVSIIQQLGVPVAVMTFMAAACWITCRWLAEHVVRPVVKSHLELIDTLARRIPELSDKIDELVQSKDREAAQIAELRKTTDVQTAVIKTAIDRQTATLRTDK